jgi:hypothetical protein
VTKILTLEGYMARRDIQLAVQKVEERFDYEGNELSTEAWQTIRAFIAEALKSSHNSRVMQCPFSIVERFADNGAFSHWALINSETGEEEWAQP